MSDLKEKLKSFINKCTNLLNPANVFRPKKYYHETSGAEISSISRRSLSFLIDSMLCAFISRPLEYIVVRLMNVESFISIGMEQFIASANNPKGPETIDQLINYYASTGAWSVMMFNFLLEITIFLAYFGFTWNFFGKTLGEKMTFIRIRRQGDGLAQSQWNIRQRLVGYFAYCSPVVVGIFISFLSPDDLYLPIFGMIISSGIIFISGISILFAKDRQMFHDRISRTVVVVNERRLMFDKAN